MIQKRLNLECVPQHIHTLFIIFSLDIHIDIRTHHLWYNRHTNTIVYTGFLNLRDI